MNLIHSTAQEEGIYMDDNNVRATLYNLCCMIAKYVLTICALQYSSNGEDGCSVVRGVGVAPCMTVYQSPEARKRSE